jgi:hypothetical protein
MQKNRLDIGYISYIFKHSEVVENLLNLKGTKFFACTNYSTFKKKDICNELSANIDNIILSCRFFDIV